MKTYSYKSVCEILKINNHNYPLSQDQIKEYFNYFINYLKVSNPIDLLVTHHTLGLCHGLYILMLGRDLHDIDANYHGSSGSKNELFNRFSRFDEDIMSEIAVLGELSRNGCKLEFYSESQGAHPDGLLYLGNTQYHIDVTKVHWENKEGLGLSTLNSLLEKRPDILNKYKDKTIVICPKQSFQIFIRNMLSNSTIADPLTLFPDEIEIHDKILKGDDFTGFSYEARIDGSIIKLVVKDIMGAIHSKLIDKSERYIHSKIGLIVYIDMSRLDCMDSKELIWRAQNSLKDFPNISGLVLLDRFAIDFENQNFDLFNRCYFIINETAIHRIEINSYQKNPQNMKEIVKLILSKDNLITNTNGAYIANISI